MKTAVILGISKLFDDGVILDDDGSEIRDTLMYLIGNLLYFFNSRLNIVSSLTRLELSSAKSLGQIESFVRVVELFFDDVAKE